MVNIPLPPGLTITTFAAPVDPAGVVTVIVVSFTTVKAVPFTPAKVAAVAALNPQPEMVTGVVAVWLPVFGLTLRTEGSRFAAAAA